MIANAVNVPGMIVCLICAFLILAILGSFIKAIRFVLFRKPNICQEEPWDSIAMPPELQKLDAQIQAQGFHPLGLLNCTNTLATAPSWFYSNEEGTIWVETVQVTAEDPAMMQYGSRFEDEALILTYFPEGETIETEMFHCRFAAKEMDAAYHYHKQMVKEWRPLHGQIHKADTLENARKYYPIYFERYQTLTFRRTAIDLALLTVVGLLALGMMLLDAALLGFSPAHAMDGLLVNAIFWTAFVLGSVIIFIPLWGQKIAFRAANAVDRKEKPKRDFADETSF